jgi:outer membrane protein TolC
MKTHLLSLSLWLLVGLAIAPVARALTLDEAIAIGRARSLQMQDPLIDRDRVNGRISEAWANALPDLSAQIGAQQYWRIPKIPVNFNGQTILFQMNQKDNAMASATLNQPLFTFGRVSAGLRAAYAARRSNQHLISNTSRSVELEVMRRFWTVLLLRDVVEARRSSLAISDSSLAKAQRLKDVGLMSDYDVLRFRVQAANQIPQLRQAENNLHLADLSLREYLGVPMDTSLSADGHLSDYDAVLTADTSRNAMMGRDDLEALRDVAEMYRNLYIIYRNSWMPILGGQVQYARQFAGDDWKMYRVNTPVSLYGGLSLTIPIPNGKTVGQTKESRADWESARLNLAKAERGAQLQLEAALRSYATAASSEEAARLAVEQAGEARRIAQTKLAQGQITPLEMDAAQLDELVARVALAQARFDRLVAGAETRMAVGLSPYLK